MMVLTMLWAGCAMEAAPPDYGLFIADGTFDPLDPDVVPPTFEDFFVDALGWPASDVDRAREDARRFFADSYGLDVDAGVTEGRLQWLEYRVDPRANYRVYALPERVVPPEGWPIREVTMSVLVIDPAGMELGGPYAGVWVPPGPVAATGWYQIDGVDPDGDPESIEIAFHTDGVMGTTVDGRGLLFCAMESEQLGTGLGHVTTEILQTSDGWLQFDFTNVQDWGF